MKDTSGPSLSEIRMIEKMITQAESGFGPAERNSSVAWLMENLPGYLDNAVRCSKCQSAHLPVTAIDSRILCAPCYGEVYVEGWESKWLGSV